MPKSSGFHAHAVPFLVAKCESPARERSDQALFERARKRQTLDLRTSSMQLQGGSDNRHRDLLVRDLEMVGPEEESRRSCHDSRGIGQARIIMCRCRLEGNQGRRDVFAREGKRDLGG